MKEGFDVKALRAFRVLRPLRLVSGVPSTFSFCFFLNLMIIILYKKKKTLIFLRRSASCIEFNSSCYGAIITYCSFSNIRYNNLCNYWPRIVFGENAYHMLSRYPLHLSRVQSRVQLKKPRVYLHVHT